MAANLITITPRDRDDSSEKTPDHWIGNPPTQFRNPWPSFRHKNSWGGIWRVRFSSDRTFVPVPQDRSELVGVREPNWGQGTSPSAGAKATWIGHSSFLVEMAVAGEDQDRGIRILMDPVFYQRMGPTSRIGPKRFSETPCRVQDVPEVDIVAISHNHYDHLDRETIKQLYFDKRRKTPLHFFCGLNTKTWFKNCGVRDEHITEFDWWDEVDVTIGDLGSLRFVCTPSQHGSRRGAWDSFQMLWCGWIIDQIDMAPNGKRVYFAGDTGYRSVTREDIAAGKDESELPTCPAFKQIGEKYGPFDLSLLPIGCYSPRTFLSGVHCNPEDAVEIHLDIQSKKSVGMHYGTVRGGISSQYEDVREPPQRWRKACEDKGLTWSENICLCDIGETVIIE